MFASGYLEKEKENRNLGLYKKADKIEAAVPSAKPKLSATGNKAETVKNEVPSFISSATILPFRFATTPYTLPSTSAAKRERG
jgi:hypothetical protein